ncbi:MAG: translation initiation factor eIF-1A [Candidatus Korarchaeum sp.]|nr:translation initiation factor eIF-1A [Candidatus Korarchaeum sp.]MDW8035340.1 translation initiation factor eIF-1A [Candidatus Korarchaeum sp.]
MKSKRGSSRGGEIERSLDVEMEDLLPAEELEVFGRVLEPLGKGHFRVECIDEVIRVCRVRGKLRGRKGWVKRGDIVLVSLWPFQKSRGDIVVRYDRQQVNWLIEKGYIPKEWASLEEG